MGGGDRPAPTGHWRKAPGAVSDFYTHSLTVGHRMLPSSLNASKGRPEEFFTFKRKKKKFSGVIKWLREYKHLLPSLMS